MVHFVLVINYCVSGCNEHLNSVSRHALQSHCMIIAAVVTRWLYSTKPRSMCGTVAPNHELRWLLSLSPVVCGQPGQCTNTRCRCARVGCEAFAKHTAANTSIAHWMHVVVVPCCCSYNKREKSFCSAVLYCKVSDHQRVVCGQAYSNSAATVH